MEKVIGTIGDTLSPDDQERLTALINSGMGPQTAMDIIRGDSLGPRTPGPDGGETVEPSGVNEAAPDDEAGPVDIRVA